MIITKNIHSHWKSHDRKSRKPIIIFSPYLTSPIPQEILEQSRTGKIYTLFKAELFASKASDIAVIKKLKELGHELFHLENLHAKIVIKQDELATIGSQNATYKGTKNLELSALFTDKATISKIGTKVNFWIKKAKPITSNMITDMESAVSLLQEYYNAFEIECEIAQKKIDQTAAQAQIYSDKKKNENFQKKLKTEIKRVIATSPTSQEEHRATIKYRKNSNETSLFSEGKNLLNWTINGTPMTLTRLSRYLCITDTGEIGWARIAKTRISMIGGGVDFPEEVISEHPDWRMEVMSRQAYNNDLPMDANIIITIKSHDRQLCIVPMRFIVSSCKTFSPKPVLYKSGLEPIENKQARSWIRNNKEIFEKQVIRRITQTFKYGSNLIGEDANFFGTAGGLHIIKVALIDKNPILVVRSNHFNS